MTSDKDNNKSISIFDIDVPDMDFSLDSMFSELKSELKEDLARNGKKVKKRKRKLKKVHESVAPIKPISTVEDIAQKMTLLERVNPTISEKTNDPLALENTPKYMTQSEFQTHYKLLLDRIQIQLGSLGGGGAVNIRDMDDVDLSILQEPETLNNATMKMRYLPDQKILQFYGDTTGTVIGGDIEERLNDIENLVGVGTGLVSHSGTANQIDVSVVGNNFITSLADNVVMPGTLNVTGITTLSSDGSETTLGGDAMVNGKVRATKFSTTSDERLKDNIKAIENPLEVLSCLEGVTFNWKADGSPDVGLIAQDVEMCLPDAVMEHEGIKSVNYNGVIGLLVEAVKELSKDNQLLRMEIDSLKYK